MLLMAIGDGMTIMSYEAYLWSDSWRQKREQRLALDGYRCRLCDHDGSAWRLEVHHRPSSYSRIPAESVEHDLTTLCARCHAIITDVIRRDRYANQASLSVSNQVSIVSTRREVEHDLANPTLSPDIRQPTAVEQRQQCQPPQRVGAGQEKDQQQALKGGS